MSTPTPATETPQARPTREAPKQGTHFYTITVEMPGYAMRSMDGTYTPAPGETRLDIYRSLRAVIAERDEEMRHANLVFFSIEPNRL